jgi:exonuclease SbcD
MSGAKPKLYIRYMKFIHTSDWHLGHVLYGMDRNEEQADMIDQMVAIVREHKPDAFLLSGDVFHTPQPSSTLQTIFTDAVVKIHEAHPEMQIIITAGNHDSAVRHEIFRTPWKNFNVHMVGTLEQDDLESLIIEIPGKGFVIAIPYTHVRNMPAGCRQKLIDMVAERNVDDLPVVVMDHTTVSGCDFKGHEQITEYTVGGIDGITLEEFGTGYDYVALGHIHNPQNIKGSSDKARYSGTPLPVTFDEVFDHSVTLVEIAAHGDSPVLTEIQIDNIHPLVSLPADKYVSWDEAKELLKDFKSDKVSYIRLNVEVEDFLPSDAEMTAVSICNGLGHRFCYNNVRRTVVAGDGARVMSVQELKEQSPLEFAEMYLTDCGVDFNEEMKQLFMQAMDLVNESKRNS